MSEVDLRAATDDDVDDIWRVVAAQDSAWWGAPDGDRDDIVDELARAARASGSLESGTRVAVAADVIVGFATLIGHGHSNVAVDPGAAAAEDALSGLFDWLTSSGATLIDSPVQDSARRERLARLGFVPVRSSFELERSADVSDLRAPVWPDGIAPVAFRLGLDDEEVHEMIYSFWTDVPGHTYRPIEEWRPSILAGPWFDPELIVLTRWDHGSGPPAGIALGRLYGDDVGWVSQLGVSNDARGLGLGRAILVEACHRLSGTDVRIIGLGVEAENASAIGLYRSVGMEIAREWVHCSPT